MMKKLLFLIFQSWLVILVGTLHSCGNPSIKDLGDEYFLMINTRGDYAIGEPVEGYSTNEVVSIVIQGDVVSFDFDSLHLIAAEKPRDSVSGLSKLPYDEAQKLFKESDFKQYYILNKQESKLFGPYNKSKFEAKRIELCFS